MNTVQKFVWIDDPDYAVYQITADHFCAGITLYKDVVCEAAPILSYMRAGRWTLSHVKDYCNKKHWKVEKIR